VASGSSDVGLLLHRLAMVVLAPAPGSEGSVESTYAHVTVRTLRTTVAGNDLKVLVAASCGLEYRPKRTAAGYVVVPDRARRLCEQAIEATADLVSIARLCRRAIASPFPWVAFEATTDAARDWLAESAGIHDFDRVVDVPSASSEVVLGAQVIDGLRDRSDGTLLLAESLAQAHPTGQFRDFFRLFERAFALPARRLAQPLEAFLHERYAYTSTELENWLEVRDAATHADVRPRLVVEADVRPLLGRVRQAAYDVLFNKNRWRDASPERRELWSPNGWTTGSEITMKQHTTGRLEATLLDQFGAYPTDLEGVITGLPSTWWVPSAVPQTPERRFRVIPAD
jgi:hypothetical protein